MAERSEPETKCYVSEIMQYSCDLAMSQGGKPLIRCFPISRLFRICQGIPAVEITRVADVDDKGMVRIPQDVSAALPTGKPWREVTRYVDPSVLDSKLESNSRA
ncbi:hypothetical protein E1B28_008362 [Marasmius oreades]|uniref:Uncharacterized protein n=1 Tax=Marasmius oreades TaxID=181124 RepID=A0A9P7RYU3_9AGAR|nr:uncharacterized protein E1B28_008362 [Marasmius oreades]KAG7091973.1 hypothetical protein E1B28_008362 [Marasmius oreades]